jgi:8-oxo-dGTP diphosphatase
MSYLSASGYKEMIKVRFHENIDDSLLKFAVVVSEYNGKWVFCKHKRRDTYEIPGGHREQVESILRTAERELFEETGALRYDIRPVCVYSVEDGGETFGMLFYAEIYELSGMPSYEIERIELFDRMPGRLTYPLIQPRLFYRAVKAVKGLCFRYVFWDWNGTLVDDADVALNSVNDMLAKRNMPPLDKGFYLQSCTTPIINFYNKVFDLEKVPFEELLKEFNEGYHIHIRASGLMLGAAGVLEALKRQGTEQIIISASARRELLLFAESFGVERFFSEILGAEDYYAESKTQRAKVYISEHHIDPKDVVVIGDTVHDFEMAAEIGAECILVSNGHQCREALLQCGKLVLDDITEAVLCV